MSPNSSLPPVAPASRHFARPQLPANDRLIATVANSRFELTRCNQRKSRFSTRNKNADPTRLAFGVRRGGIGVLSPPQGEESKDLFFDPESPSGFQILIVSQKRLEIPASLSKQTTVVLPNRPKKTLFFFASPLPPNSSLHRPPPSALEYKVTHREEFTPA
jgi:hypothetical protein